MDKTLIDALKHIPLPAFLPNEINWIVQVAVVLLLTLLISALFQRLLKKLAPSHAAAFSSIRAAVLSAALLPVRVFVWVGGLGVILDIIQTRYHFPIIASILALRPAIHILIVCWFLLRLNDQFPAVLLSRKKPPLASTVDLIKKISTIVILIMAVLLILPTVGVSISGILAFGGMGGILVGFASKDMLSNFFGAMMIHLDRPFALGDWVSLPEKNMEGTVEHIGWRQVTIRTFDKRQLFVPNAMFGNLILVNPSRMTHRRIFETIGVRYEDIELLPAILEDIRRYLDSNPALDNTLDKVANMNKFSIHSVDFVVSAYSKETAWPRFMALKETVLLEINRIVNKHGAAIVFLSK